MPGPHLPENQDFNCKGKKDKVDKPYKYGQRTNKFEDPCIFSGFIDLLQCDTEVTLSDIRIYGGNILVRPGITTVQELHVEKELFVCKQVDFQDNLIVKKEICVVDKGTFHDDVLIEGKLDVLGKVTAPTFEGNLTGNVNGTASGNKSAASFDIPHVKQKGKRIRHIVAEGPEPGIYIRGKLKDSNTIELPEYWDGLVDPDTITVTVTQIGSSQDLIVESVEESTVTIRSGNGSDIHCYYEVWAARWLNPINHSEKLIVVYEGETPDDYPDGNRNFLIGGWDYDRRHPQWGDT